MKDFAWKLNPLVPPKYRMCVSGSAKCCVQEGGRILLMEQVSVIAVLCHLLLLAEIKHWAGWPPVHVSVEAAKPCAFVLESGDCPGYGGDPAAQPTSGEMM